MVKRVMVNLFATAEAVVGDPAFARAFSYHSKGVPKCLGV
jgi:hypothetical protein